jgi:organic hydroperoxide reductase OsmC/OhrA
MNCFSVVWHCRFCHLSSAQRARSTAPATQPSAEPRHPTFIHELIGCAHSGCWCSRLHAKLLQQWRLSATKKDTSQTATETESNETRYRASDARKQTPNVTRPKQETQARKQQRSNKLRNGRTNYNPTAHFTNPKRGPRRASVSSSTCACGCQRFW